MIPQFGPLPGYINFFIKSAAYATEISDFIFFTDQEFSDLAKAPNVSFKKMTLKEFTKVANEKLNVNFSISKAYKLCDLKPMYGLIFEDYLDGYTHWGHCDFDILIGDVKKLLINHEFEKFDIFSTQKIYASGPFLIYRNSEKIKRFFMNSHSWKSVLAQPLYQGFDEAGDVIRELWKGRDIDDCPATVCSMTHLMMNGKLLHELQVSVSMKELITEKFEEETEILFDRGKLTVCPTGRELFIFHFMNRKNRTWFNELLISKKNVTFTFGEYGFKSGSRLEFLIGLGYSLVKRYWIRFYKKINSR